MTGPRRHSYGASLCVAAAVLTLVGSFQTALTIGLRFSPTDDASTFTITGWGMEDGRDDPVFAPLEDLTVVAGLPLVAAAVVLLAATVLGMRGAPWSARATRAIGPVALAGATFLAGTVWTFGMQLVGWRRAWTETMAADVPFLGEATFGSGFWLLITATTLSFAATVLSWRSAQPSPPREEPDTPVLGIPVVSRLPDDPPPTAP